MTTPSPVAFVDTETTGLGPDDEVWELAIIRFDAPPREQVLHAFVEHDLGKAAWLPGKFRADHDARYDPSVALTKAQAAAAIHAALSPAPGGGKVHVVGACPWFDTRHFTKLLAEHDLNVPWHHHLIDVEALAVGYLSLEAPETLPPLPWNSDDLSRLIGVEPPTGSDRHTALGDAWWACRIFDAVTGSHYTGRSAS